MRFNYLLNLSLTAVSLAVFVTCGPGDPTTVDRPPVVNTFVPPNENVLEHGIGDTIDFRIFATDPDEASLEYRFSLDDSVVSRSPQWSYFVEDTGQVTVTCVVSDGYHDSWIKWQILRVQPINYPPGIIAYRPVDSNPVMIIGDGLEFTVQAHDEDGDSLSYSFSVDDSLVATESEYLYLATKIGLFDVEVVIGDGQRITAVGWSLNVTPVPDTIPPAAVVITRLDTGDEPGELKLEWIAVGADGMDGVASNYLVRTSPAPIVDEESWARASERPGAPPPAAPGETMDMILTGLLPARFTYISVRAEDDFGNLSPMLEAPGNYTRGMRIAGRVIDGFTGLPMPDVHVELAHFHTTTDTDGEFEFIELPILTEVLTVSDDDQFGVLGTHYDFRTPYSVSHLDFIPIVLIPDHPLITTHYADFLTFFIQMTVIEGLPYPNHQRRWDPPIDIYAQPYENGGMDYQATIHQTALDLNPYIGMVLLSVASDVPEIGVSCKYSGEIMYDHYGVRLWSVDWYPLKGEIEFRNHYALQHKIVFQRVVRHEIGHALGLNHSTDTVHLMIGGQAPAVDNFNADELAVILNRYHIPRGVPIADYLWE